MLKTMMIMLALAATAHQQPSPEAKLPRFVAPEQVEYERRSWGAITERWTLQGREVLWEKPRKPGFHGQPVTTDFKRFTLTPLQHSQLMSAIRRAQKMIGLPDECEQYLPDGPYGTLRWSAKEKKRELKFTASCLKGPNGEKADAGFSVGKVVADAAGKAPVTGARIVD